MRKVAAFCLTVLMFGSVALSQDQSSTPDRAPLLLVQQIPLPNVGGALIISRSTESGNASLEPLSATTRSKS
jgi:hypothetical protein